MTRQMYERIAVPALGRSTGFLERFVSAYEHSVDSRRLVRPGALHRRELLQDLRQLDRMELRVRTPDQQDVSATVVRSALQAEDAECGDVLNRPLKDRHLASHRHRVQWKTAKAAVWTDEQARLGGEVIP